MLNVFKSYPYSRRYYLLHPWKWVYHTWRNWKNAWARATKGYCGEDWWDMDIWTLEILPQMLDELAAKSHAYPGNEEFDTPEKWERFLKGLAANLRLCTEDAANQMNEYYNDGNWLENKDKYFARAKEVYEEQEAIREETFKEIGRVLPMLWD